MGTSFGAGFHAAAGRPVDAAAYIAVRAEMRERVAAFASGGRLAMSVEMLIAAGRA